LRGWLWSSFAKIESKFFDIYLFSFVQGCTLGC
jgi:hypothetical protein